MALLDVIETAQSLDFGIQNIQTLLVSKTLIDQENGIKHMVVHVFAECTKDNPTFVHKVILDGLMVTEDGQIAPFTYEYKPFHYIHAFIEDYKMTDLSEFQAEVRDVGASIQKVILEKLVPRSEKKDPLIKSKIYEEWRIGLSHGQQLLTPVAAKLSKHRKLLASYTASHFISEMFQAFLFKHLESHLPDQRKSGWSSMVW